MGRCPFLTGVAPISGAVEILVAQVKAVSAETRLIMRRGELVRIMVEELTLQFLKQFHRSLDEKSIQQVCFDLLSDGVFDAQSLESPQLEIGMI